MQAVRLRRLALERVQAHDAVVAVEGAVVQGVGGVAAPAVPALQRPVHEAVAELAGELLKRRLCPRQGVALKLGAGRLSGESCALSGLAAQQLLRGRSSCPPTLGLLDRGLV